jgi:hypothetical protein
MYSHSDPGTSRVPRTGIGCDDETDVVDDRSNLGDCRVGPAGPPRDVRPHLGRQWEIETVTHRRYLAAKALLLAGLVLPALLALVTPDGFQWGGGRGGHH